MSKKVQVLFGLIIVFSMILSACAPAAEPTVVVTEAPVVMTEAPIVEVGPDAQALFTVLVADLPADHAKTACTSCHTSGMANAPISPENHLEYNEENCIGCHKLQK